MSLLNRAQYCASSRATSGTLGLLFLYCYRTFIGLELARNDWVTAALSGSNQQSRFFTGLEFPLALCDYRSVDVKNDLVPTTLVYPDREGETQSVKFNPDHKWKYVKGMETDEFVLIKCFDSINDGKTAVLTPHTAFEDPTTPAGAPLRESIELRLLVFYD